MGFLFPLSIPFILVFLPSTRPSFPGVFDNCSHTISDKGWALGIRSGKDVGRRDARFFFSLRTDRVKKATVVMGHSRYQPGKWTHVAVTYDGQRMALYVDGTRVASSPDQSGPLNSPFMASCRSLLLGGDSSEDGHCFRGHLGRQGIQRFRRR